MILTRSRDRRLFALLLVAIGVGAIGYLIQHLPERGVKTDSLQQMPSHGWIKRDLEPFAGIPDSPEMVERETATDSSPADERERKKRLLAKKSRKALAAKDFFGAIKPLEEWIALDVAAAKPHLLMGLALEGAGNPELARKYYEAAIDRDPWLADAYFGYATSSESLGDLESALGGMRAFLHLQRDADPYRLRVAQARSAIWEWEAKLGRGPWGPTRGIPPGFTEEELRRDGRGVATKMPIPGTEQADGSMKYEIKHSDKIKMFQR